MGHTRPGVFKGQVRGVSHQGQEKTLHLKAGYIDADFPSFETFPLHSHGGPYIRQVQRASEFGGSDLLKTPAGSTGRCNTGLKFTRRGFKAQGLSRALIQAQSYLVEMGLRVDGQVSFLREVLS